jgi:hypothetical protein
LIIKVFIIPPTIMKAPWLYVLFAALIGLTGLSYLFQWPIFAYWPFLIILLCPLMMMGMHGGHGDSHSHSEKKSKSSDNDSSHHQHG